MIMSRRLSLYKIRFSAQPICDFRLCGERWIIMNNQNNNQNQQNQNNSKNSQNSSNSQNKNNQNSQNKKNENYND